MDDYRYHEPVAPNFGPLEPADYPFSVIEAGPHKFSEAGNFVLPVTLAVGPEQITIWDNPSAGVGKTGPYDRIAGFLKAINRAPKEGERPDFSNLKGATGYLHLKVEIAKEGMLKGKPVNKVQYYIFEKGPKDDLNMEPPDVPRSKPASSAVIVPPPPVKRDAQGNPIDIPF